MSPEMLQEQYNLQRQRLLDGETVYIRDGDRGLILVPTVHAPESGDAPLVKAYVVTVDQTLEGIHAEVAFKQFLTSRSR